MHCHHHRPQAQHNHGQQQVGGAGPGQHRRARQPGQPSGQQGDHLLQHGQERWDCCLVILSCTYSEWSFYNISNTIFSNFVLLLLLFSFL